MMQSWPTWARSAMLVRVLLFMRISMMSSWREVLREPRQGPWETLSIWAMRTGHRCGVLIRATRHNHRPIVLTGTQVQWVVGMFLFYRLISNSLTKSESWLNPVRKRAPNWSVEERGKVTPVISCSALCSLTSVRPWGSPKKRCL